jgi:recombinational DNA repair ATPase RecF
MLRKFEVEHYRTCYKTSFLCHPHLSVLIGPNSSGKTNILQAMMLLYKIAQQHDYLPRFADVMLSSNINAEYKTRKMTARMWALINAYTDESNNDILSEALVR